MATYDRTQGTTSAPSEADLRLDRHLRLDWSALFVSGVAAFSRTPVNNTALHRGTGGQTAALVETIGNGTLVAVFAGAGAVLALVGSLLGALAAASRSSGVPFSGEFRMKRRPQNGHQPTSTLTETGVRRDETTILPPTH